MSQSSIQVLDRLARLLDLIAGYAHPPSLKELAADSELHPSTVHRILAAAQRHNWVERGDNGGYRLGLGLLKLAGGLRSGGELLEQARPIMEALRDELGESVNLAVRKGDEIIYVDRVLSRRMMRVEQVVGSHAPLHVTAIGKLILGADAETEVDAYARRTGLPAYTEHSLRSVRTLKEAVRHDHEQGYALDNEEAEPGVGCIGALIRDRHGKVAAGLSVSAPIERRRDEWIERVQQAAAAISEQLGYATARRTASPE